MELRAEYACVSAIGKCRPGNQDNFICMERYLECVNRGTEGVITGSAPLRERLLFGVFDGMGGGAMGETAAFIAARCASTVSWNGTDPAQDLNLCCFEANEAICRFAAEHGVSDMGTTAAMLAADGERIFLCNIGDSKIFRYADGMLEQLSVDHTGNALFGFKAPLTQNLGMTEDAGPIEPYIASDVCRAGDTYLICSDGLTDMVRRAEIAEKMKLKNPGDTAGALLAMALENGGADNITVIIVKITGTRRLRLPACLRRP